MRTYFFRKWDHLLKDLGKFQVAQRKHYLAILFKKRIVKSQIQGGNRFCKPQVARGRQDPGKGCYWAINHLHSLEKQVRDILLHIGES